ncbi:MAG: hypothetical protein HC892_21910 [Saprospiraceae bacterium]|nr:hypothetical protein [Saprospiraceae bacterium]
MPISTIYYVFDEAKSCLCEVEETGNLTWDNVISIIESAFVSLNTPLSPHHQEIVFLLLESKHLTNGNVFDALCKSELRPFISFDGARSHQRLAKPYAPIVTISYTDITTIYSEEKEEEKGNEEIAWNEFTHHTFRIDSRVKFWDSSIWHRFVPLTSVYYKEEHSFETALKDVIANILSYYQLGLYYAAAANSTLEFQMRMFKNSFIERYGTNEHSELVTPFKFHSETQMERKSKDEIDFLKKDWNGKTLLEALKWRMLLVDDQGTTTISSVQYDDPATTYQVKITKEELVRMPLDNLYHSHIKPKEQLTIQSFGQEHGIVNAALDEMSQKTYDIIFWIIY